MEAQVSWRRRTATMTALLLALAGAARAQTPSDIFTLACRGIETISVNGAAPKESDYAISLHIDPGSGQWCWNGCSAAETGAIADAAARPMRLTDVSNDRLVRLDTFDPATMTYAQSYRLLPHRGRAPLDVVTRVTARCMPSDPTGSSGRSP
jgi:hypothetical protein